RLVEDADAVVLERHVAREREPGDGRQQGWLRRLSRYGPRAPVVQLCGDQELELRGRGRRRLDLGALRLLGLLVLVGTRGERKRGHERDDGLLKRSHAAPTFADAPRTRDREGTSGRCPAGRPGGLRRRCHWPPAWN